MKTLNSILGEVYGDRPVKGGELKFVKKHEGKSDPKLAADRNGNKGDMPFKAKTEAIDRSKGHHGYNTGQDADVYEGKISKWFTAPSRRKKIVAKTNDQLDKSVETGQQNSKRHTSVNRRYTAAKYKDFGFLTKKYMKGKSIKEDHDPVSRQEYLKHHSNAVASLEELLQHLKDHKKHLEKHADRDDSFVSHPQYDMKSLARNIEDMVCNVKDTLRTQSSGSDTKPMISNGPPKKYISGTKYG